MNEADSADLDWQDAADDGGAVPVTDVTDDSVTDVTIEPVTEVTIAPEFRGNIDVYGYHSLAAGWFFAGWLTHTGDDESLPAQATAWFDDQGVSGPVTALFFNRNDLPPSGLGFLLFIPAESAAPGRFKRLSVTCGATKRDLYAADEMAGLPVAKLLPRLQFIISLSTDTVQQQVMTTLLGTGAEAAGTGFIEFCGRHGNAGGWFISGWLAQGWPEAEPPRFAGITCAETDIRGRVLAVLYNRPDLPDDAKGFVMFLRSDVLAPGPLVAVHFRDRAKPMVVTMLQGAPVLRETELAARLRANLGQAKPGLMRDQMLNLLNRRPFAGEDTMESLAPAINIFIDEAISCFPDGLALLGWMLVRPEALSGLWLRNGEQSVVVPMQEAVRISRHDVLATFGEKGFDDANCGFIVFVPGKFDLSEPIYLEVETNRCENAYRKIPLPFRAGLAAIRHLLSAAEPRYEEIAPAFDHVLGPAVAALNRQRLAMPQKAVTADFGLVPQQPKYSVLIPLYGRLDYAEYQLALVSAHAGSAAIEYIYILDDPDKRREAYQLFTAAWERYQVPFRAVFLERNMGFAPANNIGMEYATGDYLCYLNSDVFPGTPDWLERLAARLEADPSIGVIGPLLLYEDGTVQHQGMYFKRLPEFGNWFFCMHTNKGLRYTGGDEPAAHVSITGACMVLRRDLALALGGFDERYVIGDFEDSDLCMRVLERGLRCVVDPAVQLLHLERKSQASAAQTWRMNVTAYNAWQHERRWSAVIEALQPKLAGAG
jgi:GT2 family glycosyltransferase